MNYKTILLVKVFPQEMNLLWTLIKDIKVHNPLPCSFRKFLYEKPIFLFGNNSYEKNSIFYYPSIQGDSHLYYRVEECYETDYTSLIQLKVFLDDKAYFTKTIVLTYLSEQSTILTCKYTFLVDNSFDEIASTMEQSRNELCYWLGKSITNKQYLMTFLNGILIKNKFCFFETVF